MRPASRPVLAAAFTLAAFASPAGAADFSRTASYVVNLGGINVANADVGLKQTGARYALDLKADVSGLGQFVASGTAKAGTTGSLAAETLLADDFALTTRTADGTFEVKVGFARGDVTRFTVNPPIVNEIGRVPIERAHLTRVTDMLSAFIIKGGALDAGLCERRLRVFTGLERFDLAMRFAKLDTATSARTRAGTRSSAAYRTRGSGPASALVAAIAADANRPTSSLVSVFNATDAASVASYLPTAATTGSPESRSAADTRSSDDMPPPIPLDSPSRPSSAAASSSASTRMSIRPDTTPSSTSCTEYATSSAQSITWASRHGRNSGAASRIQSAAAASSR